jgi:hypothetical protein
VQALDVARLVESATRLEKESRTRRGMSPAANATNGASRARRWLVTHMMLRPPRLATVVWVAVAILAGTPALLCAQAVTLPRGDGSVSFLYQDVDFAGHLSRLGQRFPTGASHAHTFLAEVDYGLTEKAELAVSLPFIMSRFEGEGCALCNATPFPFEQSALDDGAYHGTIQDWHVELHYNVRQRGVYITPLVGVVIPSHRYDNIGEAAPGRRFVELPLGVYIGRELNPVLSRGYFEARYTYSFVHPDVDVPVNRSNTFLEIGYAVTRVIIVRALGTWQRTHGGLDGFPEFRQTQELLENHDRLLRDRNWRLGGGLLYSMTRSLDTSVSVIRVMAGSNSHYGTAITAIVTWNFSTREVLTSVSHHTGQRTHRSSLPLGS